MGLFNKDLWSERARARRPSDKRLALDLASIDALHLVVDWCGINGLSVLFTRSSGGTYYWTESQIQISSSAAPEHQLFLLLHECGHFLAGKSESKHSPRTLKFRCGIIEDEFAAWQMGTSLASELRLNINVERYTSFKAKHLKGYFAWALNPSKFERFE